MSKARSQAARSGSSRCADAKAHPQRDVEPGRERDHRQAGPDRQLEIEPEIDHQDGGGLADHREPAQPHQRVEAHVAPRRQSLLVELDGHGSNLAAARPAWNVRGRGRLSAAGATPDENRHRSEAKQSSMVTPFGSLRRFASRNDGLVAGHCSGSNKRRKSHLSSDPRSPMPAQPAIEVDDLVKVYKTTRAVDGISFALAARLDHRAARRQRRRQDHDHRDDPRPGDAHVRQRARARRRDAAPALPGAAPDEFREPLYRHAASAHGAAEPHGVRQALRGRGSARAHRRISPDELDLTEFLDRPTGKLSAGQKTRVALAKALINAPDVLLLDEPTASLDPDTADWVRSRLEPIGASAAPPCCSPPTTWPRSSACASASSS